MQITINVPENPTNEDVLKAVYKSCRIFRVVMFDKDDNIILHGMNYNWLKQQYSEKIEDN